MNGFYTFALCTAMAALCVAPVKAQDATHANPVEKTRAQIRKERNKLEITTSLQGTLTSYNNAWSSVSGGDNSIAAIAAFGLTHSFTKNKFTIDNKIGMKFGGNRMGATRTNAAGVEYQKQLWYKNADEFFISTAPQFKLSDNWNYGAIAKFRSQFASGYSDRSNQLRGDRKSAFMSPGYLDISAGFTYVCPKASFPIKINIAPIAMSGTFVSSEVVRTNGFLYGLHNADQTSIFEGGSSVQIDLDKSFGKKGVIRYRTTLFSFYGWITDLSNSSDIKAYKAYKDAYSQWEQAGSPAGTEPTKVDVYEHLAPTVRWENTIDIKATKFLTTSFYFQLYYNKAQIDKVQTQMLLSVGLTYTFNNQK